MQVILEAMLPRRVLAEWAIPAGLACVVVAFAAGSASEQRVKSFGLDARWVVLAAVCALALFDAFRRLWLTRTPPSRGLLRFGVLVGSFLALATLSTAWSVSPRLSFERAGSLGILFLLAAALVASTETDVRARVRLFQGLAVGAVAVGILGLLVLVVDYDAAVQQATPTSLWRLRGFTENPNTIAILAGAALPLLLGLALRGTSRRRQAGWLAGALLMLASVVAAESRGGLLAACAGALVVATLGVDGLRNRVAAATALVLVFAGGIALRQVVQPPAPAFSSQIAGVPTTPAPGQGPAPVTPAKPHRGSSSPGGGKGARSGNGKHSKRVQLPPVARPVPKTAELPRAEDEIGHPALSKGATSTVASGRLAAWKGALELIGDRPILGYGFGTETKVFVDRWYFFQGGTPENSYLGILLQLGALGLALIVALGSALALGASRALRFRQGDERMLVVMELGVLVAAAGIMLIQSYLYSVGNVASATVWISLFALGPIALEPRSARARVRATAPEAVT
jgi:hypothetical protein